MKRYLITLTVISGVMLASCDPMEEDLRNRESQAMSSGDESARKKYSDITLKRGYKVYELTEMVYVGLTDQAMAGEAEITLKNTAGDREQFLKEMVNTSMKSFDAVVSRNGGFLSNAAKRNYQAKMAAGWTVDFDSDLRGQTDIFLKIPDLPTSGEGDTYYIFLDANDTGSFLSFSTRQLVALANFLDGIHGYLSDPVALEEALVELNIKYGVGETQTGLLLPAVQKTREEAKSSGFSGGVKVGVKDVKGVHGINSDDLPGDYLRFGGYGTITGLISRNFENSVDLDWSLIQLHRRKFEAEMWLLWDEYWKKYANPTRG
jgi:hypothetical protein